MKTQFLLACFAVVFSCSVSFSQKLEIQETDLNNREVANFIFPVEHPSSACVLTVSAGLASNEATTRVSSWSKTYIASPGYGGFGGISNSEAGLMLRADGPTGKINFISGGTPVSFIRMTIDETGEVGIGTQFPREKLHVNGGDIYVEGSANGVVISSPNGNCWKIVVSNTGIISSVSVACP